MRLSWIVLVWLTAAVAHAQPVGTTRVAIVDEATLFSPAGVARYRDALKRLDAERATFIAVESPTGTRPRRLEIPPGTFDPKTRQDLQRRFDEIERDTVTRDAWDAHVESVLAPIRLDVLRALEQFAKKRGIGLVLGRSEVKVLVALPGADITRAFIAEYDRRGRKR